MVRHRNDGFVLLVVLAIVTVAALACILASSLAGDSLKTSAGDADAVAAESAARAGLAAAAEMLRWSATPPGQASSIGASLGDRQSYTTTLEPEIGPVGSGAKWFRVTGEGIAGVARHRLAARLALGPAPFAGACTCAGDCVVEHAMTLIGSGLCAGGDVVGRELITLSPGADLAHQSAWPMAAVHAGASVFAAGREIHDGECDYPNDTDTHSGPGLPRETIAGPSEADVGAMRARACSPGDGFSEGVLWLDRLPLQAPVAGEALIVAVRGSMSGGPVRVAGVRPDSACDVTILIEGSARVEGANGGEVAMRGGLIVSGGLCVASPLRLEGCLWAKGLTVRAPLTVTLPAAWPDHVPPGFSECAVSALE